MKKPFIVTLEIDMAVLAETEAEAQELALNNIGNEAILSNDLQVVPMDFCPSGWCEDDMLYTNGKEEIIIKDAILLSRDN